MVRLQDFSKINFKKPKIFKSDKSLRKITGLDSEAYTDGRTFMFCTSLGDIVAPSEFLDTILSEKYLGSNFVVWNLKYESGAILKLFPLKVIRGLQQSHRVQYEYKGTLLEISYVPHKMLRIKQLKFHGKSVRFWDMAPFYGRMELGRASQEYIGESKLDMDPELFTEEYVDDNFDDIALYCIQDAVLVQKLTVQWIGNFEKTGIPVTSLYSEASISFAYISRKAEIVSPYEYWDTNRKMMQFAFESYEGGKFEVLARGKFKGYEFDISSAYPFEIANLADIRNARIICGNKYVQDAVYGFLRVLINVKDFSVHLPCGVFKKCRFYPVGTYYLTITKQEYDYIVNELDSPGVSVEILDGAWLVMDRIRYPYRSVMYDLYGQKTYWKSRDKRRSHNFKIVMNGFYGKMAQCILQPTGEYEAGAGWNPLYASVITANTRIAVTRMQNILGNSCLAVHTDSIISRKPIPKKFLGDELGDFELVEKGDGIIVACGIYEINGVSALKGFKKYSVRKILEENPGKMKITLQLKHVKSWLQAMAQNHDIDQINLFSIIDKKLKLNCDIKRMWMKEAVTDDFLNSLEFSSPLIEQQTEPPEYW